MSCLSHPLLPVQPLLRPFIPRHGHRIVGKAEQINPRVHTCGPTALGETNNVAAEHSDIVAIIEEYVRMAGTEVKEFPMRMAK